jgi:hypothetical protein
MKLYQKADKCAQFARGLSQMIKNEIDKAISRFPQIYKMQALRAIDVKTSEAIRMTADAFVMASMLAVVEEFGFGTNERSTRLQRFVDKLQEIIDISAERYDDAVVEGLHNRLANLGIEYNLGGRK